MLTPTNKRSTEDHSGLRGWFGPARRSHVAQTEAKPLLGRPLISDPVVRDMRRYLRLRQHDPCKAAGRHPALAAAESLRAQRTIAESLEIMILAGAKPEDVALRLNLDAESVRTYELLFFDVRSQRDKPEWLAIHVLRPLDEGGKFLLACKCRAALALGEAALDAILSEDIQFPTSGHKRLIEMRIRLSALEQKALTVDLKDNQAKLQFLKLTADIRLAERKLELEEAKLSYKCAVITRELETERELQAVRKAIFEERAAQKKLEVAQAELEPKRFRGSSAQSTAAHRDKTAKAQEPVQRSPRRSTA